MDGTSRQTREEVQANALKFLSEVKSAKRNGLFIDCGSNIGQAFKFFKDYYPLNLCDYVLIEPNPFCLPLLMKIREDIGEKIEIIPAAAAAHNGTTKFYGLVEDKRGSLSDGGSILQIHNSLFYMADAQKALTVRTFSLSDFIKAKIKQGYSYITLKLDIEGSEYEVLEDLIMHNLHRHLAAMYVEFHSRYMSDCYRKRYEKIELRLLTKLREDGVRFTLWI